jgi:hypothetical protein
MTRLKLIPWLSCLVVLLASNALAQEGGAPATGTLEVRSDVAGAEVLVDGRDVGPVPVRVDVPAGSHAVQVLRGALEPWARTVEVKAGATVLVELATAPAAAPSPSLLGSTEYVPAAAAPNPWREALGAVVDLPWAGLALGVAFAAGLAAVLFFTTLPDDLPFFSPSDVNINRNAWRAMGFASAVVAISTGSLAVVLMVLKTDAASRFVAAVKSTGQGKDARPGTH